MPLKNVESIKIYIKNWSSIKNAVGKNSSLKDVWFARKKAKNCVKRGCKCKNVDSYETNAPYRRILVIPFRTNAGDIFDVYLANLTNTYKVKVNIWT
jgi:hypothetical protein